MNGRVVEGVAEDRKRTCFKSQSKTVLNSRHNRNCEKPIWKSYARNYPKVWKDYSLIVVILLVTKRENTA